MLTSYRLALHQPLVTAGSTAGFTAGVTAGVTEGFTITLSYRSNFTGTGGERKRKGKRGKGEAATLGRGRVCRRARAAVYAHYYVLRLFMSLLHCTVLYSAIVISS